MTDEELKNAQASRDKRRDAAAGVGQSGVSQ